MAYSVIADVQKRTGVTYSGSTDPTSTQVTDFITQADEIIDGFLDLSASYSTVPARIKLASIELTLKLITNFNRMAFTKYHASKPDSEQYAPIEPTELLTKTIKRILKGPSKVHFIEHDYSDDYE